MNTNEFNSNINPIKFIDQQKELTKKSLPKENRFVYNKILHLNIDSRSRITSMNEIEPYGYNSTGRNYNKEFKFKIDLSKLNNKKFLISIVKLISNILL